MTREAWCILNGDDALSEHKIAKTLVFNSPNASFASVPALGARNDMEHAALPSSSSSSDRLADMMQKLRLRESEGPVKLLLQDMSVLRAWQQCKGKRGPSNAERNTMLKLGPRWSVQGKIAGKKRPYAIVAQELENRMIREAESLIKTCSSGTLQAFFAMPGRKASESQTEATGPSVSITSDAKRRNVLVNTTTTKPDCSTSKLKFQSKLFAGSAAKPLAKRLVGDGKRLRPIRAAQSIIETRRSVTLKTMFAMSGRKASEPQAEPTSPGFAAISDATDAKRRKLLINIKTTKPDSSTPALKFQPQSTADNVAKPVAKLRVRDGEQSRFIPTSVKRSNQGQRKHATTSIHTHTMLCWKQVLKAKAWAKHALKNSENDQLTQAFQELFKLIDSWNWSSMPRTPLGRQIVRGELGALECKDVNGKRIPISP